MSAGSYYMISMSGVKHCPRCDTTKTLEDFGKSKQNKDGKNGWCLQCCREVAKAYRATTAGIYQNIKGRSNFYGRRFNMSKDGFVAWYDAEPKVCAYCDVPEWSLPLLGDSNNQRRVKLNIDRVVNEVGYQVDNLVLCCTRCNYIKSDFFTFDEMREIGQTYVKPRWAPILEKQTVIENDT